MKIRNLFIHVMDSIKKGAGEYTLPRQEEDTDNNDAEWF